MRFTRLSVISFAVLAITIMWAWYVQANLLLNVDVSWLMQVTQRLLAGGTYGNDYFEINPPLILYLYIPPVLFSHWLPLSIIFTLRIYIFSLAILSLLICRPLLSKIFSDKRALINLLLLVMALIFLVLPINDFGQREHLLVIFSMPYFLLITLRLQDVSVKPIYAVLIGVFASLGFALKPFFLIPVVFLEVFLVTYRRNLLAVLRPEAIAISVFLVLYGLSIIVFQPEYFTKIVPYISRMYYEDYGTNYRALIFSQLTLFFCFPVLFYLSQYQKNPYHLLNSTLLLVTLGFFVAHILQHARLYYHLYPALSFALLFFTLFIGGLVSQDKMTTVDYFLLGLMGAALFAFLMVFNHNLWAVIVLQPLLFFAYVSVILAWLFFLLDMSFFKSIFFLFFTILSAAIFSYWAGHTDWYAHQFFLTTLLIVFLAGMFFPGGTYHKLRMQLLTILSLLTFAYPIYFVNMVRNVAVADIANQQAMIAFLRAHAKDQPVFFFSLNTTEAFPAVDYAQTKVASRVQSFGLLRSLLKPVDEKNKQKRADQEYLMEFVAADISKNLPSLILVAKNVDLKIFLQNKKFASVWTRYNYYTQLKTPLYQFAVYQRTR